MLPPAPAMFAARVHRIAATDAADFAGVVNKN
jgi:hypothetical protein